jgi:hypothetical protein
MIPYSRALLAISTISSLMLGLFAQDISSVPKEAVVQIACSSFHEYNPGITFDTVLDSGDNVPNSVEMVGRFDPNPGGGLPRRHSYPSEHIENLVGRSDFVGTGVPIRTWSYPSEGNHFAISLYLVRLTSISIKGPEQLEAGAEIYIARAGGQVSYKGHTILAVDPDFPMFHLNQEYIFFGKQLASGLYKVDSDQSLATENGGVQETATPTRHSALYSTRSKNAVLSEAYAAWLETPHANEGKN